MTNETVISIARVRYDDLCAQWRRVDTALSHITWHNPLYRWHTDALELRRKLQATLRRRLREINALMDIYFGIWRDALDKFETAETAQALETTIAA